MKKKLVALLMSVTMVSGSMALPVYAENEEAVVEFSADEKETADLETEDLESQEEFSAEVPQEFSDSGDADFADHVDEELFSSEMETVGEGRASGGNINWGSSDSILSTDVTTASDGCALLGVKGSYITDMQAALDRVNAIRKEACEEGVPDPRNSGRKLTSSDYVPIKWSSDLEYIARIRAAEASLVLAHTRPNGTRCFTLKSPNGIGSYGEVLAWNNTRKFLPGIEQWYGEKEDWVNQNDNAVTGHYTQMIDPDNLYVGYATFINSDARYSTTTSGEYNKYDNNLDESFGPDISNCTQTIEAQTSDITVGMSDFEELQAPNSVQADFYANITNSSCNLSVLDNNVSWKSSNTSVATVDAKGLVTGVQAGSADITAALGSLSATKTIKVAAAVHEHSWDAGKITTAATCTTDGVKTYTCSICGETKTETIKATGHDAELQNAVEATCQQEGYTGDKVCKTCGTVLEKGTTIAKKDHSWDAGKVTTEATCTTDGVKTYTCSVCKTTKTETIKATGHKETEIKNAVEATCQQEGYTGDKVCKACGATLEKGSTIAKKDHTWDAGKVTTEATCTTDGVTTYTCSVCKTTKTETIKATGHKETEIRNEVEATCQQEGYTGDKVCKACGATLEKGTTIAKKDHSWDAGKVTTEATCTTDGVKTYTCSVCKTTKTEIIKATGHKETEIRNAVEATCQQEGYTGDKVCKACGATLEKGTTIAKKDHSWDAGKVTTEATCTTDGVTTYTCSVCKTTKTETIKATGHKETEIRNAVEATCQQEGYTGDKVCKTCGATLEKGTTIAKKDHSWDAGKVTTAVTCTTDGEKTYTCSVCKTTKTETIKATGHKMGEWKTVTAATTQKEGKQERTCTACDYKETKSIPKLPVKKGTFKVTPSKTAVTYNGKAQKPSVTVYAGNKKLSSKYYTVSYRNNTAVGTATITVTGKGNYQNYSGKTTFRINLQKTTLSALKSSRKGQLQAAWKKTSGNAGYQIQYAANSRFSGAKVKNTTRTNYTIKGLKSKGRYYVRVRTYKKVGGKYWYSGWSNVRNIKIK